MPLIPAFLTNYIYWLGLAGALVVFSFLQNKGDTARAIGGFCAAIGVLIYCFTKL